MKVARQDTLPRQDDIFTDGEPEGRYKKRQLLLVADDYDFEANSTTDVTDVDSLSFMRSANKFNYVDYRDSLIAYADGVTFSNLSSGDKEVLCKNFAVDKSDRDSVFSGAEQKKYAKEMKELVSEANKQESYESGTMLIADEAGVPDLTNYTSSAEFGTYVAEVSHEEESSTKDSKNYQTKLTLTTTNITSGKYRIGWYFESNGSDKSDIESVVVLNGSDTIMDTNIEMGDKGNWIPNGGFKYETISEGVQTIDIKFKTESKDIVSIRRARLEIMKIS